jgi:hypothetical protein
MKGTRYITGDPEADELINPNPFDAFADYRIASLSLPTSS